MLVTITYFTAFIKHWKNIFVFDFLVKMYDSPNISLIYSLLSSSWGILLKISVHWLWIACSTRLITGGDSLFWTLSSWFIIPHTDSCNISTRTFITSTIDKHETCKIICMMRPLSTLNSLDSLHQRGICTYRHIIYIRWQSKVHLIMVHFSSV